MWAEISEKEHSNEDDAKKGDSGEKDIKRQKKHKTGNAVDVAERAYLQSIESYKLLSIDEERELARRIKAGDEKAKEEFINRNLRLSYFLAKKYFGFGMDNMDLVQIANMALIKAVNNYDYNRSKFSTFATKIVLQNLKKEINRRFAHIGVSESRTKQIWEINKFETDFLRDMGRKPTQKELEEKFSPLVLKNAREAMEKIQTVSLDAPCDEDNDEILYGITTDEGQKTPEEKLFEQMCGEDRSLLATKIMPMLDELDPCESKVLRLYMGLFDNNPYNLKQISAILKLDQDQIYSIHGTAMRKIMRIENYMEIRQYL